MNYFRNLVMGKKTKDPIKLLKNHWKTFHKGYHSMIEIQNPGVALKIMHSSEVKGALAGIIQIYIEEEAKGNFMAEHLEIIEMICGYTKMDKPKGFFKLGVSNITKLLTEIENPSFLSH